MTLRFERMFIRAPIKVMNYDDPETWTEDVKILYERLESGDATALAPLIEADLEFLSDNQAMRALVTLKYLDVYPSTKARAELRKIANIIRRKPGRSQGKLPSGELLYDWLKQLSAFIEAHDLLLIKKDAERLKERIEDLAKNMNEKARDTLVSALLTSVRIGMGYVRRPRSWALQALAVQCKVAPKMIEKRIERDPVAKLWIQKDRQRASKKK